MIAREHAESESEPAPRPASAAPGPTGHAVLALQRSAGNRATTQMVQRGLWNDLRSTFASDALHAGIPVFTLAKVMGTSVRMIERHYGALLDGASAGISGALDALDAERDRATGEASDDRLGH